MRQARTRLPPALLLALLPVTAIARPDPEHEDAGGPRLGMTQAVACLSVAGYEDYEERPEPRLTADEKLLVYYRPLHFATERDGDQYRAHLVQDARIRRRGRKAVLQSKDKIVEYVPRNRTPPANLYLTNAISLTDLPPGDYDLDIVLHDAIATGPPATQSLPFSVIAEPDDKTADRRKPKDAEP